MVIFSISQAGKEIIHKYLYADCIFKLPEMSISKMFCMDCTLFSQCRSWSKS